MIPIVSIVGKSNTGKTTLAERLLKELKGRGYRVAMVKHALRELDMDRPGTDSSRLVAAGADGLWVVATGELFMRRPVKEALKLEDLPYYIGPGFDIILAEGFKEASAAPRIEVHRKVIGGDLVSRPEQLLAVVSDEPLKVAGPLFSWEQMGELATLIETRFLSEPKGEAVVDLFVNEHPVSLKPIMANVLARTVTGLISALKGVGQPGRISLHIRKNAGTGGI